MIKKGFLTKALSKCYLPDGNVLSTSYDFDKSSNQMLNNQLIAIKLINNFFAPLEILISKPVFTVSTSSVIVNVFYYIPDNTAALNVNTINNLGDLLSKVLGRPVELRLVKLYYPYLNAHILAQFISLATRENNFAGIVSNLLSNVSIVADIKAPNSLASELPSQIVGIKVRISGRLLTEESRPRFTIQTTQIGSFTNDKLALIDKSLFTSTNAKGTFTIKVWISQRLS